MPFIDQSVLIKRHAFSLVELSIVLVILGLLAGGILSGQALIRAAELRSVSTEYQRYVAAVQSFRDRYFSLPGDMTNATKFWGTTTASGTVDGNGDGFINLAAAAGATGENFQFWRQLALSGLIEGTYTGLAGPGGNKNTVPGTNAPRSKMATGAWDTATNNNYIGSGTFYAYDYGNYLVFGGAHTTADLVTPILKPEEAWNIDTKLDDGKPGAGKVVAGYWSTCATSTTNTDYAGSYALSTTSAQCNMYFTKAF